MNKLALQLPGGSTVNSPPNFNPQFTNLASVISGLLNIAFYIAVFLAFYWLVWGAWAYLFSSGKKEELAKARSRITWALVGLIVVFLAYFIAKYTFEIFPAKGGGPF